MDGTEDLRQTLSLKVCSVWPCVKASLQPWPFSPEEKPCSAEYFMFTWALACAKSVWT